MSSFIMIMMMLIFAYLCGSLSSAIIVCRLFHLPDPRTQGSGNPGTTNVLRLGGKKIAVIVLLGDILKGLVPVIIAKFFVSQDWLGWIALAAIIGHSFPVFFQFKGGKGVATAAGVLLALAWPLGIATILTWLLIAITTRYSSLAALVATVLAPIYSLWLAGSSAVLPLIAVALFVIWRHQENIRRLFAGTEPKIGRSA